MLANCLLNFLSFPCVFYKGGVEVDVCFNGFSPYSLRLLSPAFDLPPSTIPPKMRESEHISPGFGPFRALFLVESAMRRNCDLRGRHVVSLGRIERSAGR